MFRIVFCETVLMLCFGRQHVIRLVIFPPEHVKNFPAYRCEVPVTLTTDQYGTQQSELLAMSGVPFPALGLSDPSRHLRTAQPL